MLALAALTAACVFLEMDGQWGTHVFRTRYGGDPALWQHLFWFFGHRWVYVVFLPATGMVPGHSLYGAANANGFNPACLQTPQDRDKGPKVCGGTIVFGGGVPLHKGRTRVGGLGASGDTACADREIAKRMRDKAGFNPPGGSFQDDIWFTKTDGASAFAHPLCKNTWRNGKKIGDEDPAKEY